MNATTNVKPSLALVQNFTRFVSPVILSPLRAVWHPNSNVRLRPFAIPSDAFQRLDQPRQLALWTSSYHYEPTQPLLARQGRLHGAHDASRPTRQRWS